MLGRRGLTAGIVGAISIALTFAVVGGAVGAKKKGNKLTANLSGANEVPPTDPNASGKANVRLNQKKKRVCFKITFEGIENPFAGHIHKGKAGINGPVRVPLFELAGLPSPISDCTEGVKKKLIKKIKRKPRNWYVNLHTDADPGGAIRGQLQRGGGGGGGHNGGGDDDGGGGGGGGY